MQNVDTLICVCVCVNGECTLFCDYKYVCLCVCMYNSHIGEARLFALIFLLIFTIIANKTNNQLENIQTTDRTTNNNVSKVIIRVKMGPLENKKHTRHRLPKNNNKTAARLNVCVCVCLSLLLLFVYLAYAFVTATYWSLMLFLCRYPRGKFTYYIIIFEAENWFDGKKKFQSIITFTCHTNYHFVFFLLSLWISFDCAVIARNENQKKKHSKLFHCCYVYRLVPRLYEWVHGSAHRRRKRAKNQN